ncbi:hypothetical protein [Campylobacter sp. RM16189]|uniref:hypothetical protein n=1 Tax=Campylobacter sp. RM16189 TaxID=1705726 RepID=UPI001472DB33|nr:hypothetical protein [Campylobacter sp. RM16189]
MGYMNEPTRSQNIAQKIATLNRIIDEARAEVEKLDIFECISREYFSCRRFDEYTAGIELSGAKWNEEFQEKRGNAFFYRDLRASVALKPAEEGKKGEFYPKPHAYLMRRYFYSEREAENVVRNIVILDLVERKIKDLDLSCDPVEIGIVKKAEKKIVRSYGWSKSTFSNIWSLANMAKNGCYSSVSHFQDGEAKKANGEIYVAKNHRSQKDIVSFGNVMIFDVDNDHADDTPELPLSQAKLEFERMNIAAVFIPSQSHQREKKMKDGSVRAVDRYRIIVSTEKAIEKHDIEIYRKIQSYIAETLRIQKHIDPSALNDSARAYAQSLPDAVPTFSQGEFLSAEFIRKAQEIAIEAHENEKTRKHLEKERYQAALTEKKRERFAEISRPSQIAVEKAKREGKAPDRSDIYTLRLAEEILKNRPHDCIFFVNFEYINRFTTTEMLIRTLMQAEDTTHHNQEALRARRNANSPEVIFSKRDENLFTIFGRDGEIGYMNCFRFLRDYYQEKNLDSLARKIAYDTRLASYVNRDALFIRNYEAVNQVIETALECGATSYADLEKALRADFGIVKIWFSPDTEELRVESPLNAKEYFSYSFEKIGFTRAELEGRMGMKIENELTLQPIPEPRTITREESHPDMAIA